MNLYEIAQGTVYRIVSPVDGSRPTPSADELRRRIIKARNVLLYNAAAKTEGAMVMNLPLVEHDGIPTMATDGEFIYYNTQFLATLSQDEIIGTMVHEAWHCGLIHFARIGKRNKDLWNQAADYAINGIIRSKFKLPCGILYDAKYEGWSVERIYDDLVKNAPPKPPQPQGDGRIDYHGSGYGTQSMPQSGGTPQGFGDQVVEPNTLKPTSKVKGGGKGTSKGKGDAPTDEDIAAAEDKATEARGGKKTDAAQGADEDASSGTPSADKTDAVANKWGRIVQQASALAREAGTEPGSVDAALTEIEAARTDYVSIIRRYLNRMSRSDYSYTRPNRRMIPHGFYMPSLATRNSGTVVFAIDCSGSMDDALLQKIWSHVRHGISELGGIETYIIACDTRIATEPLHFMPDEELPDTLDIQGRGGTDFRPPFEWLDEQNIEVDAMLYYTDLECNSFPDSPTFPVLWVTDSMNGSAPFGEVLRVLS